MNTTLDLLNASTRQAAKIGTASPAYQAFRILHIGFVAAPIIAGLDKFFHLLVNWDQYLPAAIARLSPIDGHDLMSRCATSGYSSPHWRWPVLASNSLVLNTWGE